MPTDAIAGQRPIRPEPASRRTGCMILAALLVALLFWLGSMPFAAGLFPDRWDKVAHVFFYAALAMLLHVGMGGRRALLAIALTAAVGALDEWHQQTLPGRSSDWADWIADFLAASVAVGLMRWWRR